MLFTGLARTPIQPCLTALLVAALHVHVQEPLGAHFTIKPQHRKSYLFKAAAVIKPQKPSSWQHKQTPPQLQRDKRQAVIRATPFGMQGGNTTSSWSLLVLAEQSGNTHNDNTNMTGHLLQSNVAHPECACCKLQRSPLHANQARLPCALHTA